MMIVPRTPPTVTPDIRAFARSVLSGREPIGLAHVPCQARRGSVEAECFAAVDDQVRELGGTAIQGWALWEHPGVLLEAEFHAVWCSPLGGVCDVVNRGGDPRPHILFIPDPTRRYAGAPLDTVRLPLVTDPRMDELLRASEAIFEIMNRGDRATRKHITIPRVEHERLLALQALKGHRLAELVRDHGAT
ncbi:MAG: hypothetical protein V4813_13040 [Gemmatimonadota bacterium]